MVGEDVVGLVGTTFGVGELVGFGAIVGTKQV